MMDNVNKPRSSNNSDSIETTLGNDSDDPELFSNRVNRTNFNALTPRNKVLHNTNNQSMQVDIGAQQETVFLSVNFDQSIIDTSGQLHRRDIHKDSNKLSTEEKIHHETRYKRCPK